MRDFVRRPPIRKQPGQIDAAINQALDLFQEVFQERHILVRLVQETRCRPWPSTPNNSTRC